MSRQLHYIVPAFLLLIIVAGLFKFLQKIPADRSEKHSENTVRSSEMNTVVSDAAVKGKTIFMAKCASCHMIFKDATGPALAGLEDRHKWADRNELYKWIKNPAAYMQKDAYTQGLKKQYGSMMTAFGDVITNEEIDAIVEYIRSETDRKVIPIAAAR